MGFMRLIRRNSLDARVGVAENIPVERQEVIRDKPEQRVERPDNNREETVAEEVISEMEDYYCKHFDLVVFSAKRQDEKKSLFKEFSGDAKLHSDEVRKVSIFMTLTKLLERAGSKLGHENLMEVSWSFAWLTRDPFLPINMTDLGDSLTDAQGIFGELGEVPTEEPVILEDDRALQNIRKSEWLEFVTQVARIPKLAVTISRLTRAAVDRIDLKHVQTRKQLIAVEAWTRTALNWFEVINRVSRLLMVCREAFAKPSTLSAAFECFTAVYSAQFSTTAITKALRAKALLVLVELCAIMAQSPKGKVALIGAGGESSGFLSDLAKILRILSTWHHHTEMFYYCQCLNALALDKVEDGGVCQELAFEIFKKLNMDLAQSIDDEIDKKLYLLKNQTEGVDDEGEDQEDGDMEKVDDDEDVFEEEYVLQNKNSRIKNESYHFASFRLLISVLIRIANHPNGGRRHLLDAGTMFTELVGEVHAHAHSRQQAQEEGMEITNLDQASTEEMKNTVLSDHRSLNDNGVSHLWLHILRIEQTIELTEDESSKHLLMQLKKSLLDTLCHLTPPHVPPPTAVDIILGVFIAKSKNNDEILHLATKALETILLTDVAWKMSHVVGVVKSVRVVRVLLELLTEEKTLSTETVQQMVHFMVQLGTLHEEIKWDIVPNGLVRLLLKPATPPHVVRACTKVLYDEIFSVRKTENRFENCMSWIRAFLGQGFLLLFNSVFKRCDEALGGVKPLPGLGEASEEEEEEERSGFEWQQMMVDILANLAGLAKEDHVVLESLQGNKPSLTLLTMSRACTFQKLHLKLKHAFKEELACLEEALFGVCFSLLQVYLVSNADQAFIVHSIEDLSDLKSVVQLIVSISTRLEKLKSDAKRAIPLIGLLAHIFNVNHQQVLETVFGTDVPSQHLLAIIGSLLSTLHQNWPACDPEFLRFTVFIQVRCLQSFDLRSKIDDEASANLFCLQTLDLLCNVVKMQQENLDALETGVNNSESRDTLHLPVQQQKDGNKEENAEDVENKMCSSVWNDWFDSACFLSASLWTFVRFDNLFCEVVLKSKSVFGLIQAILLACEVLKGSPNEGSKQWERANSILLLSGASLFLLVQSSDHLWALIESKHRNIEKNRRVARHNAVLLQENEATSQESGPSDRSNQSLALSLSTSSIENELFATPLLDRVVHASLVLCDLLVVQVKENLWAPTEGKQGMVMLLASCFVLARRLGLEKAFPRLQPLLPSLLVLEALLHQDKVKTVHEKPVLVHKHSVLFRRDTSYLGLTEQHETGLESTKRLDTLPEDIAESGDYQEAPTLYEEKEGEEEEEEEYGDQMDEEIIEANDPDSMESIPTAIDVSLALRQAIVEVLSQAPMVRPEEVRKQGNFLLISTAPAGLFTLNSLSKFRREKLDLLDGKGNDSKEKGSEIDLIVQVFQAILRESMPMEEERQENKRKAKLAASMVARQVIREEREKKLRQMALPVPKKAEEDDMQAFYTRWIRTSE